jgi:hypothetical protein
LGCSDLISSPRTGVEAILTKLCVAKSNQLYAVSSDICQMHVAPRDVLCVSQQSTSRGAKNIIKIIGQVLQKHHVKKVLQNKGPLTIFLRFVFSRFWPFLCMTSSKKTRECFPKSDQKIF